MIIPISYISHDERIDKKIFKDKWNFLQNFISKSVMLIHILLLRLQRVNFESKFLRKIERKPEYNATDQLCHFKNLRL